MTKFRAALRQPHPSPAKRLRSSGLTGYSTNVHPFLTIPVLRCLILKETAFHRTISRGRLPQVSNFVCKEMKMKRLLAATLAMALVGTIAFAQESATEKSPRKKKAAPSIASQLNELKDAIQTQQQQIQQLSQQIQSRDQQIQTLQQRLRTRRQPLRLRPRPTRQPPRPPTRRNTSVPSGAT